MSTGIVVRYDRARGYGFIHPDQGGEDVFLHARSLEGDDEGVVSGLRVEFEVIADERGLKAVGVRPVEGARPAPKVDEGLPSPFARSTSAEGQDDLCEVLSEADFIRNVTELAINAAPTVTGAQVIAIRQTLLTFARRNGWVD